MNPTPPAASPTTGLTALSHASVGAPITRAGLSLFPIYLHSPSPPPITPAIDALSTGHIHVTETGAGTVPYLEVTSTSDTPVLFPEGDTVAGGKQNRTLNVSVLVPANSTVSLPVSCVERGRWGRPGAFRHGDTFAPRTVRRTKTETMHRSPGSKHGDQGRVWAEIENEFTRTGAHSPSRSVHDSVAAGRHHISDLLALRPLPEQAGVLVTRGRTVLGIDVFATPELLAAYWPSILSSYAVDAGGPPSGHRPSATVALRSLRHLACAPVRRSRGVGLGSDLAIDTRHLVGVGLEHDDRLIHLSAFGRDG